MVDGDFVVFPGATLSSPTGNLTIYAKSITVQQGGSIAVAPTGKNPAGQPSDSAAQIDRGRGGSYGTLGWYGNSPWGSTTDSDIAAGSPGEDATFNTTTSSFQAGPAGLGGGSLRLFANAVTIAGLVSADGQAGQPWQNCLFGGGGGSGGGILIAGATVAVSGALSANGGQVVGCGGIGNGGQGRIKILSGGASLLNVSANGVLSQGLLPPIPLTSTSHPDPAQTYNDNFPTFDFAWAQPFPSVQGYYLLGSTSVAVPTPANAQFSNKEFYSLPESALPGYDTAAGVDGGVDAGPASGAFTFYFQAVPINSTSTVGTVETVFPIRVNATPPTVTSSSHPTQTAWSTNPNAFFAWTFPIADTALSASYYVLDHYGDTVPGAGATLLPISQKSQLLSNLANGVWVFHMISQDTRGYFTKHAGSYRVNIGADPGTGSLVGTVVDATSKPVVGATVTVNRGLYTTTTNSSGTYNFSAVPALSWEVSASYAGQSATGTGVVTAGGTTTTNLTL